MTAGTRLSAPAGLLRDPGPDAGYGCSKRVRRLSPRQARRIDKIGAPPPLYSLARGACT